MRKTTLTVRIIIAIAAMISCLLVQAQTQAGFRTNPVHGNEMMFEPQSDGSSELREPVDPGIEFERSLARFHEMQQSPLTTSNAEALLLGDIIWQRLAGENEFYLAPVITDFDAYYSRIKALDNRDEGINKSVFTYVKLPNDDRTKALLATMNIHMPDYYTIADVVVYLPEIDIDELQNQNVNVELMDGYGNRPVNIEEPGGTRASIYFQGWETSSADHTITGQTNTQWGRVSCQAYSGSWTMWCAGGGSAAQSPCSQYTYNQNTTVQKTTGINVTNYANRQFRFRYKHRVEENYDYFKWYYSSDGTSWILGNSWTGPSADWPNYSLFNVGLTMAWTNFFYRFEFTSDNVINQEGAFVDHIEMTGDQGCTSSNQYPGSTLTPEANWKYVQGIYAGEFSRFSVVNGTQYHWSLCPDHCGNSSIDSELTLRRFDNDQILAYANDVCGDDARISWTANFTGDVKVVLTKFSCESQNIFNRLAYKSGTLENASLSVTPSNWMAGYLVTSSTFTINSNSYWEISGWPSWVTSVIPSSGTGNQTITVTYQQNNQGGPLRIATLNASMLCGSPVSFTITQFPDPGCNSTTQYGAVTYNPQLYWRHLNNINAGRFVKFNVTQGQQYHWSLCPVHGGDASYNSELTLRNDADDTFLAYSDDDCGNDAMISWIATFTGVVKMIISENFCNSSTVNTRLAFLRGTLVNPSLSISPASRTVSAFAGSTTFNITSNTTWSLSGFPSWMSVSQASGNSDATITVSYDKNNASAGRSGVITIASPGLSNTTFTLSQTFVCNSATQYPSTTLVPENYWKHQSDTWAGEYSLHSVIAGQDYHWSLCAAHGGSALGYDSQLTLRRASDDEFLAYSDDDCGNDAMISWTATFTGNVKVIVSEYYCGSNFIPTCLAYRRGTLSDAVLSVSPANRNVVYNPGSTTFNITANAAWNITSWPSWVNMISPINGTGNATVTVHYSTNNTGGPARVGTIQAKMACSDPILFTVTQASDPGCLTNTVYGGLNTPTVNWQYVSGIFPGEYARFSVSHGTQYHFSLCPEHCGAAGYDSELTLRTADNTFIGYDNNTCGNDARITWTANFTGEVRLHVSQYPCTGTSLFSRIAYKSGTLADPTLSVSPTNRPVSSVSGSTTFALNSNSTWTISGWPAWITSVSPASGSGNATITVNYDANATGSMRVGTINAALPCGGIVPFTVTQGEAGMTCPNYNFSISVPQTWQLHSSSHGPYSNKIYRFYVYNNAVYSFKTGCGDGAIANYDTFLEIYNSSCNLLTSNDDGCESLRSKIEWVATYTGYAYLVVKGHSSSYGDYTLAYRREGCMEASQYGSIIENTDGNWRYVDGIWPGEFAAFYVIPGAQYHWSLCSQHCGSTPITDSELTLRNYYTDELLAYNDDACGSLSRISWTSDFTGVVKVIFTKYMCQGEPMANSTLAYKSGPLGNASFAVSFNRNVNWEAGSTTFNVTTNVANWVVNTAGLPAWITSVSPSTGSGNATITVTYAENTTTSLRSAELNFFAPCGGPVTRTLTQGEQPKVCPDYHFTRTPSTSWLTHTSSFGPSSNKIYRINVTNGNKYTFKTGCGDGATAEFDTELLLYDNNCNQVAYNDDGCESLRSILEWDATYTGVAYLLVRGFDYTTYDYGEYTLAYIRCVLPSQPGTISGNTSPCQGSQQTYSVSPLSGATSYTWTLPSGWGGSSTSNVIVATAGTGGGDITVAANNDCGAGPVRALAVTVTSIPAQPGAITGPATVCSGTIHTYSVAAVPGATAYTWSLPSGWSGSSTTNSINATAGASGGLISVTASNACGTSSASTLTVNVISIPPQPGAISGPTTVVAGSTHAYSISPVSGAESYSWLFSGAGTISGSGTNINLTVGSSGTLSVTANNTCGSSPARTLDITATSIPPTLPLQDVTITPEISPICYDATQTITLAGGGTHFIVQNNANVELVAGINIVMLPGTWVHEGGRMLARITETSDYCAKSISIIDDTRNETIISEKIGAGQHSQLFRVFPNPTTGLFTLELLEFEESSPITVEIYSMLGEKLMHTELPAEQYYYLDLSGKQTGMYLIKVMAEGRVGIEKLLKK